MYKFIQKITAFLNRFGRDRYYHFIFALILAQLFAGVLAILGCGSWSMFLGPCLVLVLCFIKEALDAKHGSGFEPYDIVWGFLGMFTGMVLAILLLAGFVV